MFSRACASKQDMLKIANLSPLEPDFLHNISIVSAEDPAAAYILSVFAEMQPTFWLAWIPVEGRP